MSDRRLLVHADDLGAFQSSLAATAELLAGGIVRSASAMVPAPWFADVIAWCTAHPEADIGLHLTLTSEWPSYRWRPTSPAALASPLADEQGCFPPTRQSVVAPADVIEAEVRSQIAIARRAGMRPTHLDSHMFVLREPRYIDVFQRVGRDEALPVLIARSDLATDATQQPLFDSIHSLDLRGGGNSGRIDQVMRWIDALGPGLHALLIHPAAETPELRAAAADWRSRVADLEAFRSTELAARIDRAGVRLVGYRDLP
jgi:chitin disaccharide deacetylase